jgi:hypothetical protein
VEITGDLPEVYVILLVVQSGNAQDPSALLITSSDSTDLIFPKLHPSRLFVSIPTSFQKVSVKTTPILRIPITEPPMLRQ